MKNLLNGEKIDIDLAGFRGSDAPGEAQKDQKMLESIQKSIKDMTKNGGKKNLGLLSLEQKQFIRDLLAFAKKPRKLVTLTKGKEQNAENSLHFLKYFLQVQNITETFDEIQSPRFAKLVGLLTHFCYWCVFSNFNRYPLDDYHMKQLFISIQ